MLPVLISTFLATSIFAQDISNPAASATPQLSYGVSQIVQLTQAKVGEDTIIAYIKNSGNGYGLNADQIIYLRQKGVSDAVVSAMLNQPKNMTANAAPTPAPQNSRAEVSTAVAQPTVTYETVPSSTVYVMPDTQTYDYDNYYYQPYYYPYYAAPFPAVSFSFGFGGGGFRGRGFHGGGFHGGGFHGHR